MAPLKIKKPIELAGLKSQLIRAEGQEKAIVKLSERYGEVQGTIDELIGAHTEHVGDLEHYAGDLRRKIEGMVGTNGDPNETQRQDGKTNGQDGQRSGSERQVVAGSEVGGVGQVISSETDK